jgi:ribosomal protein S18 acetylase RimI-like enzyme
MVPELVITGSFEGAMKGVRKFKGEYNYAALAGEPSTFKMAVLSDDGFCGLWELESGPWILGLGAYEPLFIPTVANHASTLHVRVTMPRAWLEVSLEKRSEWNFFLITSTPKQSNRYVVQELTSSAEINAFIERCAPDSSTRPGDSEILYWHGIQGEDGELLSVGGAVRWKNGTTMLVSIATDPIVRGKSMAQEVTASLVKRLFDSGEIAVGLGVWAQNAPAIRAYEKVGFRLAEEFVSGPLLLA